MNKFLNTIKSEIKAVVTGTQLIKNYEVDKEPYMYAGLHKLFAVYRAKRRGRDNQDVSIFMLDKKTWDKKKSELDLPGGYPSPTIREDSFNILKKDAANLMKLRHPSILNLIEQPQEDDRYIVFITEPVEYSLACLAESRAPGGTKDHLRDKIPGVLEIKIMLLELLEALNFMHQNAKVVHAGLAPETIFINREGKVRIGGLNFCSQLGTEEEVSLPVMANVKFNEHVMYPNLKFAAPEISQQTPKGSVYSDIFSCGCLLFFLLQLTRSQDPYILTQFRSSDPQSHQQEVNSLQTRLGQKLSGLEYEVSEMLRQTLQPLQHSRGNLNQLVTQRQWFQDPLLKTIRYLENIDFKDKESKVQFLNGLQKVLDKFDKKIKIEKIIPLLMKSLEKDPQLSINVLPIVISQLSGADKFTSTQFRERVWPSIIHLCGQKELPAQALYLLLKNQEVIVNFVSNEEFGQVFLPLITKSLTCGVAKLQILALNKVNSIFAQLDYQLVKSQIIPRILQVMETATQLDLKIEVFSTLKVIMKGIDAMTLKNDIMKSLERVRAKETDPRVCMKMLEIYEEIGKTLGPDQIGLKILPGIIPMLISGQFTKPEFKNLMGSVRRLLDQIEDYRLQSLPDSAPLDQANAATSQSQPQNSMFAGMGETPSQPAASKGGDADMFAFLESGGASKPSGMPASTPKPADAFGMSSDPFGSMGSGTTPAAAKASADPFGSTPSGGNNSLNSGFSSMNLNSKPKPADPFGSLGGNSMGSSMNKPNADPFGSLSTPSSDPFGSSAPSQPMNLVSKKEDPFAELMGGPITNKPPAASGSSNAFGTFGGPPGGNQPPVNQGFGGNQGAMDVFDSLINQQQAKPLGGGQKQADPFADLMGDMNSQQKNQFSTFGGNQGGQQQQQQNPFF